MNKTSNSQVKGSSHGYIIDSLNSKAENSAKKNKHIDIPLFGSVVKRKDHIGSGTSFHYPTNRDKG